MNDLLGGNEVEEEEEEEEEEEDADGDDVSLTSASPSCTFSNALLNSSARRVSLNAVSSLVVSYASTKPAQGARLPVIDAIKVRVHIEMQNIKIVIRGRCFNIK